MAAAATVVGGSSDLVLQDVSGWTFGFVDKSGQREEPLARDIDIAVRLGYVRPRKIRDLIVRLEKAGKLHTVHRSPTVGRRGFAEEIVNEYWLTEAQALKVAAKSETDPADAILDEMIRVYTAARAGRLPAQSGAVSQASFDAVVQENSSLRSRLGELRSEMRDKEGAFAYERARLLSGQRSTICDAELANIRGLLAEVVDLWLALGRADTKRAALQLVKHRAIPGAFSKGFRLRYLPKDQVPGILRALEVLKSDATAEAKRVGALPKKGATLTRSSGAPTVRVLKRDPTIIRVTFPAVGK